MKAAILAAGLGERLQQAGISTPKPLLEVGGKPLIDHVLSGVTTAGIGAVACIVNDVHTGIEAHCRAQWPQIEFEFVRRTTPSSMESLFALSPLLGDQRFLLLTVDSIVAPAALDRFVQDASRWPSADGVLALTDFVEDEKPLWARADRDARLIELGPGAADSGTITAGFYLFAPAIFAEVDYARRAGFSALRHFLGRLVERGYDLRGVMVPKTVDVDRPEDIAIAEAFLRSDYSA